MDYNKTIRNYTQIEEPNMLFEASFTPGNHRVVIIASDEAEAHEKLKQAIDFPGLKLSALLPLPGLKDYLV